MKFITGLFLFLISGNVFAVNLCSTPCELNISYPGGGSIEAIEPVTITFGAGGYIDDGATVTGFSAGETISLEALESIDFDDNGSFELGYGGNIDYTSLQVDSTGEFRISSADAGSSIKVDNIVLLGLSEVSISGGFDIADNGALHIKSGETTVSTSISLSGHRSLNAYLGLEAASVTLENQVYDDVTSLLLIDTDDAISLDTDEAVIEPISVSVASQAQQPAIPVTENSESSSGSGGSGSTSLPVFLALFLSLLTFRYRSR